VASPNPTPWLNRFAWFTAGATLLLICSGGMVTSKGVGLAVPDWPTTFGYNMFLFPFSKWVGGVLFEHTHRLIASLVGFLTIILATWIFLADRRRWVRNLGFAAVGAVVLQGILGGLRVTMLKDQIGIFHACLAQAFFGLLVLIAVVTTQRWCTIRLTTNLLLPRRLFRIGTAIAIAVYLQLALGATMRHQHRDLSIVDFPTAYGQWIPDTSARALVAINAWRDTQALSDVDAFQIWLQMVHRFGAVVVAVGVVLLWSNSRALPNDVRSVRTLSNILVALVFCQIALGAWTIWSNKAADIATAHVAVGATIFGLTIAICTMCHKLAHPASVSASSAAFEPAAAFSS
jgi:cytochrome c oxidase assembly protein subunit 15